MTARRHLRARNGHGARLGPVLLMLALGSGCAGTPPVDLAAADTEVPRIHDESLPPIGIGETVFSADGGGLYRLHATPGETVTITARATNGDAALNLLHTFDDQSPDAGRPSIATDFGMAPLRFDINGPNAELVVTLPDDADGIYVIHVFNHDQPVSLTVAAGAMPAEDIIALVPPRPDNAGAYLFPMKQDGALAAWVASGARVAQSRSRAGTLGRSLATAAGQVGDAAVLVGALGEALAHAQAIRAIGGWEYIRETSDQSFDSLRDMARWLHYRYADHADQARLLTAITSLYPEFDLEMAQVRQGK